jgi:beta-glucosidase
MLNEDDLSLINIDLKRVVEPGYFQLQIGASSNDIRLTARIKIE